MPELLLFPKKTASRLTQSETVKVSCWLTNNYEKLIEEKPTLDKLAKRVNSELGMHVTEANCRSLLRSAGLQMWKPIQAKRKPSRKSGLVIRKLAEAVTILIDCLEYPAGRETETLQKIKTEIGELLAIKTKEVTR